MMDRELVQRLTIGVVSILLLSASPGWAAGSARSEIEAANRNLEAIFARGDASGMAALYTEGAQILPAGSDFVAGEEAITRFWQGAFDAGMKQVSLATMEVERHGDVAYEVGTLEIRGADGSVLDQAKYLVIWKKEGGSWKLHRDIWTTSVAPGPE